MIAFTPGQIFIVTGASSGIGLAVAQMLNELGASVIAIARDEKRLGEMRDSCSWPERVFIEKKDLAAQIEELPAYVKSLREKYGLLQGLAYCAGVGGIKPLRAVRMAQMQKIFDINYFAPVFMAKGFADRRYHAEKGAAMVFIASAGGVHCDPGMTIYSGSKGALIASMQSIAREIAPDGVRVNCVSPTLVETRMAGNVERSFAEGKYPLGLGKPADVAAMIVFLLSDRAGWLTCQNYILDCGAI